MHTFASAEIVFILITLASVSQSVVVVVVVLKMSERSSKDLCVQILHNTM